VGGILGELGALAYCTSKAALIVAVKTAALELARFSYRVNCIAPGMIETPMLKQYKNLLLEEQISALPKKIPLGLGNPNDVANAAVFLLSDAAKWITGTTLVVDGGYTCGGRLTN
jgi:NAD(P)-dependent dehydrogenase (short-subunit alcohol dehydrogenase family)